METKKKQVAAYCRVSTDGQVGDDKFGLDVQRKMILDYCAKNNMEIVGWFVDEGKSGATEEGRDELNTIVYGATNPPIQAVVCAKSDRIARDVKLYYYYKHVLTKKDIELISVSEDFGEYGAFAHMLEAFVMLIAEQERTNITMRTSSGRKMKASLGGYAGGKVPYGYKVVDNAYALEENESKIVKEIFKLRDSGCTYANIVSILAAKGYKTRKGKDFETSTLYSIVSNRKFYQGYYKYGKQDWVKGQHKPILKEN